VYIGKRRGPGSEPWGTLVTGWCDLDTTHLQDTQTSTIWSKWCRHPFVINRFWNYSHFICHSRELSALKCTASVCGGPFVQLGPYNKWFTMSDVEKHDWPAKKIKKTQTSLYWRSLEWFGTTNFTVKPHWCFLVFSFNFKSVAKSINPPFSLL